MRTLVVAMLALVAVGTSAAAATDARIKKAVIQESIASYAGTCPCPYSVARNGTRCGRRSAYSRPGGYAPICYASDVSPSMITQYRTEHHQ